MARVTLSGVCVEYPVYHAGAMSLRNRLVAAGTGGAIRRGVDSIVTVKALEDVSFTLTDGDRVGLLGHNGAGKSTLLRTLAGIFTPTAGRLEVEGEVSSILHLGAGMDPELSGRENIIRMAMFMGASLRQAQAIIPDIEAFADLGDFLSMPVHSYSAGMLARLAFGVATAMRPDILLIDEVLGVGDAEFQQKARQRIEAMMEQARILVLASHSEEMIRLYCNRTLTFAHGRLVADHLLEKSGAPGA
ncbi:MAG: ABC transporter ATP-binding protein [Alphaproteobacteria bacterium]|nr:MAG: ABC transporter ATP-binding protein [Alphaproteobacteria bacterium]